MTRYFSNCFLATAISLAAQLAARADATNGVVVKSAVLENEVAYLLVGGVETNLPEEIQSAQNALATTNKIAGTVLDLRFATGDDSDAARAAETFLIQEKLPLAILVNDGTRGAAVELVKDLRAAKAGLVFGDSRELSPDVLIVANASDEKRFLENPFGTLSTNESEQVSAATNDFLPFVDHTSEADLVRAKIKDGDEDENFPPARAAVPKPFIRDPVLARAVDLIEGLAALRPMKN